MFIPTRIHAVIDYIVGAALIAAPWLFGFARNGPDTWVPVVLGAGVILYSLLTDYEYGVVPLIKMPVHLLLDAVGGAFLAVSPWLLGYADYVWVPHVVVGVAEILIAAMTHRTPGLRTARHAAAEPGPRPVTR